MVMANETPTLGPLEQEVDQALDSIRDYLKQDGGDVRVHKVTEGENGLEVELELLGACVTCSMSDMTMKAGIEEAIRKQIQNVDVVKTIN